MKPKRKFLRSIFADGCFFAGLAIIAVAVAVAGYGPLAMAVAGMELTVVGVLLGAIEANREEGPNDPG